MPRRGWEDGRMSGWEEGGGGEREGEGGGKGCVPTHMAVPKKAPAGCL
jgi:hypothetical protein